MRVCASRVRCMRVVVLVFVLARVLACFVTVRRAHAHIPSPSIVVVFTNVKVGVKYTQNETVSSSFASNVPFGRNTKLHAGPESSK